MCRTTTTVVVVAPGSLTKHVAAVGAADAACFWRQLELHWRCLIGERGRPWPWVWTLIVVAGPCTRRSKAAAGNKRLMLAIGFDAAKEVWGTGVDAAAIGTSRHRKTPFGCWTSKTFEDEQGDLVILRPPTGRVKWADRQHENYPGSAHDFTRKFFQLFKISLFSLIVRLLLKWKLPFFLVDAQLPISNHLISDSLVLNWCQFALHYAKVYIAYWYENLTYTTMVIDSNDALAF